jgi:hypothetical protein
MGSYRTSRRMVARQPAKILGNPKRIITLNNINTAGKKHKHSTFYSPKIRRKTKKMVFYKAGRENSFFFTFSFKFHTVMILSRRNGRVFNGN